MSQANSPHDCTRCLVLRVRGLDCAEEVSLLRRALRDVVDTDGELSFDLMRGTMTVHRAQEARNEADIFSAVRKAGLEAEAVAGDTTEQRREAKARWADPRLVMLGGASAAAIALGYFIHTLADGPWAAFSGSTQPPLLARLCFMAAVAVVMVHVLPKAYVSLRFLRADMHLLMGIAMAGALALGAWSEGATVAVLFIVSLLLESWNLEHGRRSVSALMALAPDVARVRCPHDGDLSEKPVRSIAVGSVIIVRPGERIPLDGEVIEGETLVDQSPMTGESVPVPRLPGEAVLAGTINQTAEIAVRVERASRDTTLARMLRMIEETRNRRAPVEQWVDIFARYYTPAMIGFALLVATGPPLAMGQPWADWIYRALVVLVIACPCALVISTPVAITAALSSAARNGVLIKGGLYLEQMATLRGIAFDKTGTLTTGQPEVTHVSPEPGVSEDGVLRVAAALERGSTHPLAQAILRHAEAKGITAAAALGHRAQHGLGVEGEVDGTRCWAGNPAFAARQLSREVALPAGVVGATQIVVGRSSELLGWIALTDAIRPEAKRVVNALHQQGLSEIRMLTGDNRAAAEQVMAKTGVDSVAAELLPEDKVREMMALRDRLDRVAMVGDGVNDAPALAAASVGIAMGAAGSDAALESADIALMSDDLRRLPWLVDHARKARRIIVMNIAFALGTKALFLILAALGLAGLWSAIAADMGASFAVVFHSLRLLRPTNSKILE